MAELSTRRLIRLGVEPLVEAIWELRFEPNHEAAAAVIFGKLLSEFGSRAIPEQLPIAQVPTSLRDNDPALRYAASLRFQADRFWYACGDRVIVLSSLKPYVKWDKFRSEIGLVADTARATGAIRSPERMSVKYTNIIALDSVPTLSRLNLSIRLGVIELKSEPFHLRTEFRRDGFVHIITAGLPAMALGQPEAQAGVLLDIDSILEVDQNHGDFWSALPSTLEKVHAASKDIFLSLLTPETLAAFHPEYEIDPS